MLTINRKSVSVPNVRLWETGNRRLKGTKRIYSWTIFQISIQALANTGNEAKLMNFAKWESFVAYIASVLWKSANRNSTCKRVVDSRYFNQLLVHGEQAMLGRSRWTSDQEEGLGSKISSLSGRRCWLGAALSAVQEQDYRWWMAIIVHDEGENDVEDESEKVRNSGIEKFDGEENAPIPQVDSLGRLDFYDFEICVGTITKKPLCSGSYVSSRLSRLTPMVSAYPTGRCTPNWDLPRAKYHK